MKKIMGHPNQFRDFKLTELFVHAVCNLRAMRDDN
jgi:hypothetical protein